MRNGMKVGGEQLRPFADSSNRHVKLSDEPVCCSLAPLGVPPKRLVGLGDRLRIEFNANVAHRSPIIRARASLHGTV
jgi:hypothetical protein